MTNRVYAYLRASTKEQDASRAKSQLEEFAKSQGLTIAAEFIENESGGTLQRPKLFELLRIAQRGDVLLVEQVDRLSRLNAEDWQTLRETISAKGVRIVSLDLPTSHMFLTAGDEFTGRMFEAFNGMMLDMLAAIARKDYEDRRRRQAQGIRKAVDAGKMTGRPVNTELHDKIRQLKQSGSSYAQIQRLTGASSATVAKALKK